MFPLARTARSVSRARLFPLMLGSVLLALLVVAVSVAGITVLAASLAAGGGWLAGGLATLVSLAAGIGGWFLLPVLVILIGGVFQESVVRRVEAAEYPDNRWQGSAEFLPNLWHDLRFTALALGLNLLILPFYLLGIGMLLAIMLNSYLLGREFFESVAGLHLGKPAARRLGKRHRRAIYGGGLGITLATLVPVLNLFVPILATVWMVHLYHLLASQNPEVLGDEAGR